MDEEPKARSKSVSLLPELWEKVEAKAAAHYGSNRSAYIRELVEQDLEGRVDLSMLNEREPLRQLAESLHPTIIDELENALHPGTVEGAAVENQTRILSRFLEALVEALKRDDFRPNERFHLYNSLDQLTAVTQTEPGKALIKGLAEFLQRPEFAALAAEPPATYGDVSDASAEAERRKAAARKSDHKPTKRRQSGPSEPKAKE